ncbi:MAG: flagellar basal body P-ring protein FlgI [Phycisphaerae bacterium]|nr:flagellar basal body P-ring protein FlgI [Phycisphaerae bacterium]
MPMIARWMVVSAACVGFAAAVVGGWGCASEPPKPKKAPPIVRNVPDALRGTVASEASLNRVQPVIVSGYGLVVGLNGTGGGDLPERIAATMERELGLRKVAKGNDTLAGTPLAGMSPREVLRSPYVAVVMVYGLVAPGAPEGAAFDIFVSAISRTPDMSLEGGKLWTTDLQIGPPTAFGGERTKKIARASGPIFVNPFVEGGRVTRQDGRVLGGGRVTSSLPLELILDNESHSRATSITRAINARFSGRTGSEPTARGRTGRVIDVTVPPEYRDSASEFLNLITHVQIDGTSPEEYARRYIRTMKEQPYLAEEMGWCLQALPRRAAVPFLREVYDWPDHGVRMAALRAGAGLNDPLSASALKRLASSGSPGQRAEAIALMGKLAAGPTIDPALREHLEAPELTVRVAAYEALADRAERIAARRWLERQETLPVSMRVADPDAIVRNRAELTLSGDTPQGVRRRVIDGKFILDEVEGGEPLIYVTQQGRPRVVLFGPRPTLTRPITFSAWNDRLMVVADSATDRPRLMYRHADQIDAEGERLPGAVLTGRCEPDVASLVAFMAQTPTPDDPRPGLAMTYSELVGALHAMQQAGAIRAAFAVEEDVLRARLLAATQDTMAEERPETTGQAPTRIQVFEPKAEEPPKPAEPAPMVVPLPPPARKP